MISCLSTTKREEQLQKPYQIRECNKKIAGNVSGIYLGWNPHLADCLALGCSLHTNCLEQAYF